MQHYERDNLAESRIPSSSLEKPTIEKLSELEADTIREAQRSMSEIQACRSSQFSPILCQLTGWELL